MADKFDGSYPAGIGGLDWPATHGAEVTPNDSVDLSFVPRFLYVGTAGDLCVTLKDDESPVVLANVPVGWVPIRPTRVLATGTTAEDIVALA